MRKPWLMMLGVLILTATMAEAQASRTWVSGVGDDANPCSRTAPCKTFAGAISKTAAGGEINTLDSGGFGGVTITKSISIVSEGVIGGVLVAGGVNGININAAATDVVVLRGLDINGLGTGLNGIRILQAGSVHVENCIIYNFSQMGIEASLPTVPAAVTQLFVRDTIARNNRGGMSIGGAFVASLNNVRLEQNRFGVQAIGTSKVSISNSVTSGNVNNGIMAVSSGAPVVQVMVDRTVSSLNGESGIFATGVGANIRMGNTTVFGNGTGLKALLNANIFSYGTNRINGNTVDGAPTADIAEE